jgi:hypothetical protein
MVTAGYQVLARPEYNDITRIRNSDYFVTGEDEQKPTFIHFGDTLSSRFVATADSEART